MMQKAEFCQQAAVAALPNSLTVANGYTESQVKCLYGEFYARGSYDKLDLAVYLANLVAERLWKELNKRS